MVKNPPAMWETWVRSLGLEDPLEKEMATHSSILAWRIPWTEEPGRLQSRGSQRVGHDMQTKPLPWCDCDFSWVDTLFSSSASHPPLETMITLLGEVSSPIILLMRELNPRRKMCFIQLHTAATSQSRMRSDYYPLRSLPMALKLHQASKGTALVTPSPPHETSAHLWLTTPTLSHHFIYASGCVCVCPKSLWLCLTPCNPMNYRLPAPLSMARILQWVAISPSKVSSQSSDWTHNSLFSCIGRRVLYH